MSLAPHLHWRCSASYQWKDSSFKNKTMHMVSGKCIVFKNIISGKRFFFLPCANCIKFTSDTSVLSISLSVLVKTNLAARPGIWSAILLFSNFHISNYVSEREKGQIMVPTNVVMQHFISYLTLSYIYISISIQYQQTKSYFHKIMCF